MPKPTTSPASPEQSLPLFRPEAMAAQQQKFYGELLRIRPLSIALLLWLAVALAGIVLGVLLWTRHSGPDSHRSTQIKTKTSNAEEQRERRKDGRIRTLRASSDMYLEQTPANAGSQKQNQPQNHATEATEENRGTTSDRDELGMV